MGSRITAPVGALAAVLFVLAVARLSMGCVELMREDACAGTLSPASAASFEDVEDAAYWRALAEGVDRVEVGPEDPDAAFARHHAVVVTGPLADPTAAYRCTVRAAESEAVATLPVRPVPDADVDAYESVVSGWAAEAAREDCAACAARRALELVCEGGRYQAGPYDEMSCAYSAVMAGAANCVGWTAAYADVCARAGVPCRGISVSEGTHMVAELSFEGGPFYVDVTSALDGASVGSRFLMTADEAPPLDESGR